MVGPRVASRSCLRSQEQHRSSTKALGGVRKRKKERGKRKRSEGFGEVGDNKKLGFLEYPYISVCN